MASHEQSPLMTWWDAKKGEVGVQVIDMVSSLYKTQRERMEKNIRSLRLYGNVDMAGTGPYSYSKSITPVLPDNRVRMNIVASMTDTVVSKIGKMKPRVTTLTSGGDFMTQEKAKKLNKFILGAFYKNDIYTKHCAMFRDGTVFDLGALKHYIDEDSRQICTERVLATELFVDAADAMYGCPSHLYQIKYVHKDVLKKSYPKEKTAISLSASSLDDKFTTSKEQAEYVVVVEAWHLPTTKNSGDGRHVICTDKATLVDEEYNKSYFPFTFSRWVAAMIGFYGTSLAERLTGNQIEINKMLRTIQKSFHLGSAFKVFLEYGSKVSKEHLNNDIGSLVYYTGTKPEFYVPQTVHPEYFRHLEWLIRSSYEEAGVSQLSATSKKPSGIESGRALREYNDIGTERFATVAQAYEATFLETARIYVDLARDMEEMGIDMEVTAESKRFIESIKWSEIGLENNEYIMQMFPTSMLPHEPAGRLAFVQELVEAGLVPPEYATTLLDFPDLESYLSLKNAPIDDIMDTLDTLLYRNQYEAPEPFQNLALGIPIMQSAYLRAKKDRVPEERLELIRRWLADADSMMQTAKAAQQSDQMAQQSAMTQAQQPPQEVAPPEVPAA